ncbi:dihydrodipicolinate synthase family protein [Pedobacter sp. Du54]|uniref:dihydrodipicolinate synthase family protein n=1 Tax=Pedobacter anseongensis TaxID=3133439 RepID=UPI0030AA5D1D
MEKLTAKNLKGNWATLLLPIKKDESIDFDLLGDEIDKLIAFEVDGIYSNGTAGEFHNQTEAEFDQINELLAEKCSKVSMRFQIGCSHPSPIISLERIQRAVHLNPDAFQVILPDWVVPQEEEQLSFLQRIEANAKGIPLVLYNPPHAKLELEPEDYQKFKTEVPSLIGIKVLSKNDLWVEKMKEFAAHLSVFVPGHFLAKGVKAGIAAGAYSNIACINPGEAQRLWNMMHTDIEEAIRIENNILEFFKQCIAPYQRLGYSNPALDKFLAAVGGWCELPTRLRWPYKWIPEAEVLEARKRAKELIPSFFMQ